MKTGISGLFHFKCENVDAVRIGGPGGFRNQTDGFGGDRSKVQTQVAFAVFFDRQDRSPFSGGEDLDTEITGERGGEPAQGVVFRDSFDVAHALDIREITVEYDSDRADRFRLCKLITAVVAEFHPDAVVFLAERAVNAVAERLVGDFGGETQRGDFPLCKRNELILFHERVAQLFRIFFPDSARIRIVTDRESGGGSDRLSHRCAGCHDACGAHRHVRAGDVAPGKEQVADVFGIEGSVRDAERGGRRMEDRRRSGIVERFGMMVVHAPAAVTDDVGEAPFRFNFRLSEDVIAHITDVFALSGKFSDPVEFPFGGMTVGIVFDVLPAAVGNLEEFVADFVGNPAINFIEAQGAQKQDGTVELTMLDGVKAAYTPGEPVNLREWFAREEKNAAASVDTHAVEKANRDSLFKYHIAKVEEDEFEDEVTLSHEDFVLGIRPEFLSITGGGNVECEIYGAMPTGMESTVKVRIGEYLLTGVVFGSTLFTIGSKHLLDITGSSVMLFDRSSGRRITSGTLKLL